MDNYPWTTRPAWETAIRKAKDELTTLSRDLVGSIASNILVLFPTGPTESVDKFCSTAKTVADAFVLDANTFYSEVVEPAWNAFPRPGTFNLTQIGLVTSYLKSTLFDAGVEKITTPDFSKTPFYKSRQELFNYIKTVIRRGGGDEYNLTLMLKSLEEQIIKSSFTKTTIPVIITNTNEGESRALSTLLIKLGAKVQRVENFLKLTEEVDEETIMSLLGKVKTKAKKNEKG